MPKTKGVSDFFSWNLFRFVRANPKYTNIFEATWNPIYGNSMPDHKWVMIGMKDQDDPTCFYGRHLPNVCSGGAPNKRAYCCSGHDVANWKDITEEFWKRYMEIGVCAIHGDFAHKWIEDGRKRICEYCGKIEHKIVFIESVERWVKGGD